MDDCDEIDFTFDKIFNFVFGDHFLNSPEASKDPGIGLAADLGRKFRSWLCKKKKTSFLAQESSFVNMVVCNTQSLTCPRDTTFAQNGGCNIRPFFGDAIIGKQEGEEKTIKTSVRFNEAGISIQFGLTFIPERVARVGAAMLGVGMAETQSKDGWSAKKWWNTFLRDLDLKAPAVAASMDKAGASGEAADTNSTNSDALGIKGKVVAGAFASNFNDLVGMLTDFTIQLAMCVVTTFLLEPETWQSAAVDWSGRECNYGVYVLALTEKARKRPAPRTAIR